MISAESLLFLSIILSTAAVGVYLQITNEGYSHQRRQASKRQHAQQAPAKQAQQSPAPLSWLFL
jgi:hypothetical protein